MPHYLSLQIFCETDINQVYIMLLIFYIENINLKIARVIINELGNHGLFLRSLVCQIASPYSVLLPFNCNDDVTGMRR